MFANYSEARGRVNIARRYANLYAENSYDQLNYGDTEFPSRVQASLIRTWTLAKPARSGVFCSV